MKELMTNDLDNVFYNENEFAIEIEHTNEEKMALEKLIVIFDEKTEIILDNSSGVWRLYSLCSLFFSTS